MDTIVTFTQKLASISLYPVFRICRSEAHSQTANDSKYKDSHMCPGGARY